MVATEIATIVDGDGHVMEDQEAIARFLPARFAGMYRGSRAVFPPFDQSAHRFGGSVSPPGAFQPVGAEGWRQFLQAVGIGATVLYPTAGLTHGRIANRDWAIAATRAYNDWLHDTYLRRDSRFKGMGLLPMQEPEMAVEELRHVVGDLGMCGAMLPATGLNANLGSKEYWPVYREAERLGCALAVHGGEHNGLGLDSLGVFAAVHAYGHPFGVMISFAGIITHGIFDKFPNLKIAFLEGGVAWFLMAMERLDGSFRAFRPHDALGELLQCKPGEGVADYIARHVKEGRIFVGVEGDEPLLAQAVKMVGNQPFLYSSDFPHEVNETTCKAEIEEVLENEELTEADKAAILYGNAERFYNLAPS